MNRSFVPGLLLLSLVAQAGDRDNAIHAALQRVLDQNEVPGAVTAVISADKGITHLGVIGFADAAKTRPLRKNSIFWIASMTKPITAVAVMMMQDEGKLSIEDPLNKYLPGFDSRITLRHMLTHTSGMGDATDQELQAAKTLADLVPIYSKLPVAFEPGSRWKYCQSGINMLARVVEIVSGQQFPDFLEQRIFRPLGMKDTTFYLRGSQLPRLVTPAKKDEAGKLSDATIRLLNGKPPTDRNRYPAANGGLFSTAPDYARFAQMLLHGGEWKGRRYISKASFDLMTSNQTGKLKAGFIPGHAWGLGVGIVMEPQGQTANNQPGTFGHGGAYGTQAWIDRRGGAAYVLMVQRSNFPNADDSPVRRAFQDAGAGK